MKKTTFLIIALLIGNSAFSQSNWWQQAYQVVNREYFEVGNEKSKTFKFTGNPFLEDDFMYGSIIDEEGNSRYAYLRYNAIEEIVEIKLPGEEKLGVQVLPKVKEITYSLNDYKYIFDSFITSEGEKIEGYIMEYFKGETFGLYGNPIPKLSEGQRPKLGYDQAKLPHLSVDIEYYIKKEDGTLHKVKLNKKDFKNVLPVSKELDEYMAGNSLKTTQDFAAMLLWFENL